MSVNKLVCPACTRAVKKITAENGAVCCPHCKHVMFQYQQADETLTRAEFMALLNTDRGTAAGVAAADWFPRMNKRLAQVRGAWFVAWMWPELAGTFDA